MAVGSFEFGLSANALNAWAVWILPFVAAVVIPGVAKFSKRATGVVAVAFALASAISAATLLPLALGIMKFTTKSHGSHQLDLRQEY